jgi:hypothetical protein
VQETIINTPLNKKNPATNLVEDRIREYSPIQCMKKTDASSVNV